MAVRMRLDVTAALPVVQDARRDAGCRAWIAGSAAEDGALRAYLARGAGLVARRWRGAAGEVDLIVREGACLVFCEVKRARSFAHAMERLRPAQMRRIAASASEYLGQMPDGQLSLMRLDLAAVDGQGRVRIVENAFGDF